MKHLFLINPAAGKKGSTQALIRQVEEIFPALGLPYEIILTSASGDACRLARQAAETGGELRIYACGGDGTLNELINGVAGYSNVAVTNVPKGTGNDFLRIFGPRSREGFSDLAALAVGPQATFDLIDCNGLLGIGVVCTGLDARVAADVHRYKGLPLVTGMGAYILALASNFLLTDLAQPTVVQVGAERMEGETTLVCICNGRFYGGGFMPVGDAQPDDGVLDMLVVPRVSRLAFLRLVRDYAKGRYRSHPTLIRHFHGPAISISSSQEQVAVVDGEVLRAKDLVIRLSEKTAPFFYPQYLDYHREN